MLRLLRCAYATALVPTLPTLAARQSLPALSIGDVSALEGSSGASTYVFTVTLSATSASTVTVAYATQAGTATAGSYLATSGTLTRSGDFGRADESEPLRRAPDVDPSRDAHKGLS